MHISAAALVVALAVMLIGGFVQGTVGFGSNLVAVPIVGLLVPAAVPGAFFVVSLPMCAVMAFHEREHIDWPGARTMLTGRVPGALAGLALLSALSATSRLVAVGVVVVLATVATARGAPLPVTRTTQLIAGAGAGLTGTVAGVDGPTLALLHQRTRPEVVRGTLAVTFAGGGLMSLALAATQGLVQGWHLVLSLALIPALLAGQELARRTRHRVPPQLFRGAVLTLTGIAGASAIARGLLG